MGKRRIHGDGLVMLERHYSLKEQEIKALQMENRIKRLQFEEERSKKLEQTANERAEKMLDARKRHFDQLVEKKNHYKMQKEME